MTQLAPSPTASPRTAPPALRISRVRFRYGQGPQVLDIPAFELAPGEQALLAAPSGAGKSTLLHLIGGLLDLGEGSIEVAGQDIHALSGAARDRYRGRHIGMIFQTFNLLPGFTAIENVEAALLFANAPGARRQRAQELLQKLAIDRVDAPVETLSVGQQQRVAVARAVATSPALVLADEPTASLDPENASAAMDLIQRTCRDAGAALLCVSHDPALAQRFPRRLTWSELNSGGAQ